MHNQVTLAAAAGSTSDGGAVVVGRLQLCSGLPGTAFHATSREDQKSPVPRLEALKDHSFPASIFRRRRVFKFSLMARMLDTSC